MRVFFIGDVVAKSGRRILSEHLGDIKKRLGIDFVIANAENAAGGNGITKNIAESMFRYGIDVITLGDHTWDQRCFENEIDSLENLCRPANIPHANPGRDFVVVEKDGVRLGVFCLLGQTLMKIKSDCPFTAAEKMLEKLVPHCDVIFLDFHAETTSEKVSMAWHLDGKVAAVVGTHTHIPTNDARIFPQGTAFLSDAGMTGPWNSCLGREWGNILKRFIDGRPHQFLVAEGDDRICACIVDIDPVSKRATRIEPFIYPPFPNTAELWLAAKNASAESEESRDCAGAANAQADSSCGGISGGCSEAKA